MLSMLQTAGLYCRMLRCLAFTAGSLCSGGWAAAAALMQHYQRGWSFCGSIPSCNPTAQHWTPARWPACQPCAA
jgi:hypothetical protein